MLTRVSSDSLVMTEFLGQLEYGARRSWYFHRDKSKLIGMIVLVLMPTAFLIEELMTDPAYNTGFFRLFATAFAIPLLVYDRLPQSVKLNFHWFWLSALLFTGPFTYSVVFLMNAALADGVISYVWMFEFMFAIVLLIQVSSHALLSAVTLIWGVLLGSLFVFWSVADPNWSALYEYVLLPSPVLVTTAFVLIATNRNVFKAQENELKAVASVGSAIAHELRTPLATIRSLASGTKKHLPLLVESYKFARREGHVAYDLRDSQVQLLREAHEGILDEVEGASVVIDMLLMSTLDRSTVRSSTDEFQASSVIQEALRIFPYNNSRERRLVQLDVQEDFEVRASRRLVLHVLLNLMKNSIRYVQKGKGTEVLIRCSTGRRENSILVRDDGVGIEKSRIGHLFDLFYTSEDIGEGSGIGLNFCKIAMESIGGSIVCRSREDQFTEFELKFPLAVG